MSTASYRPADDRYDEWLDRHGEVRAHWRLLNQQLQQEPALRARRRRQQIDRQIQDNGVTYNVYADPRGSDRLWQLDPLPQIIAADEWASIAAGVSQRADLLNRTLVDLYGPQSLLREGLVPAELVHGHSNFLWPAQGVRPADDTHLHVYAADLARAPDGRWWVLADRTQTPSGAGYALENRAILANAYPELIDKLGVREIGANFQRLRDNLCRLAQADDGDPLLVLLTPGVFNETYFEHAFLANQMGIPLVEGNDLTVRDRSLFLKTLDGLRRVHAVFRRVDGGWCDPLELRSGSAIGVPGLLDVARAGRVQIANALGSGVVQSPALMGFLPRIAERLLGAELSLPSLATWWCGEAPVAADALIKLDKLVVKPSFPLQRFQPVFVGDVAAADQAAIRARIAGRGYAYVAQERIKLSQTPVLLDDGEPRLAPRSMVLRVFALATAEGYQVIPGGLTRVAAEHDAQDVSMQRGGHSKDTWVLGAPTRPNQGPAEAHVAEAKIIAPVRSEPHVLSRIVEHLFWLGRYCERSETHARVLRSLLQAQEAQRATLSRHSHRIALKMHMLSKSATNVESNSEHVLQAICSRRWPGSLWHSLDYLHNAALRVRASISRDNWRAVRELHTLNQQLSDSIDSEQAFEYLNRITIALAAMSGFALAGMTRDASWHFLMSGRRLEYLQQQSQMLNLAIRRANPDRDLLGWLLDLGRSSITYRRRYLASPQLPAVLDLLVTDASNPYALTHQLQALIEDMQAAGIEQEISQPLAESLRSLRETDFFAAGRPARLLQATSRDLRERLLHVGLRLSQTCFAHVESRGRATSFA